MSDPKIDEAIEISDVIVALASKLEHPMYGTIAIIVALSEFLTENVARKDVDTATELAKDQIATLIAAKLKHVDEEKKMWN